MTSLPCFKTPEVRDLAVTLTREPLLSQTPFPSRHPLSASIWRQQPETLAAWLVGLDKDPAPLREHLAQRLSSRLGRYHEALWHFAFIQAPDIQLHAHNWVIDDGTRTLGEMDFILQDAEGLHQLEVAIKFYLVPHTGAADLFRYQGIDPRDSLGQKVKRLSEHQLRLSEQPAAQRLLAAKGWSNIKPSGWLTGELFHPERSPSWCYQSAWQNLEHWQELPRSRWLSPYLSEAPSPLVLDPTRAQMLVKMQPAYGFYKEQARVLLVPEHWPQLRAPCSPPVCTNTKRV